MYRVSDEDIENIEILSKLELSDKEKIKAKEDMEIMLNYFDKMNELDTEGVEPLSHIYDLNNVFREDVVTNIDDRENMLSNAPEVENHCFKVPKTVN